MSLIKGFIMAIGMYSIIPVYKNSWDERYTPFSLPALPLVGAMIGSIWFGLSFLILYMSIPVMLKSVLILFIPFVLSGALHLDGYIDTADAVFSRKSLDEKKRILKDPHIGAFAVIATSALFLLQFGAVFSIIEAEKKLLLIAFIPVISRCIAAIAALNIKPVFESGYIASFKKGTKPGYTIFACLLLMICCISAWFIFNIDALPLLAGVVAGALTIVYLYKQFRGISGDLTGCIITVSEAVMLVCMAVI